MGCDLRVRVVVGVVGVMWCLRACMCLIGPSSAMILTPSLAWRSERQDRWMPLSV